MHVIHLSCYFTSKSPTNCLTEVDTFCFIFIFINQSDCPLTLSKWRNVPFPLIVNNIGFRYSTFLLQRCRSSVLQLQEKDNLSPTEGLMLFAESTVEVTYVD
jgi:hypothetical protein